MPTPSSPYIRPTGSELKNVVAEQRPIYDNERYTKEIKYFITKDAPVYDPSNPTTDFASNNADLDARVDYTNAATLPAGESNWFIQEAKNIIQALNEESKESE